MLKKVNQGYKVFSKLNQKMKIQNVDLTTSLASRNGEFVAKKYDPLVTNARVSLNGTKTSRLHHPNNYLD